MGVRVQLQAEAAGRLSPRVGLDSVEKNIFPAKNRTLTVQRISRFYFDEFNNSVIIIIIL
jgi:hypothetical protein